MSEAAATQALLSLNTALGETALRPVAFHSEEAISTPYIITVDAVSDRSSIDPDSVLYQPACLTITWGPGTPRLLHGIVRTFSATGQPVRGQFAYTLTIVPKLWFMAQTRDCRIFTNTSVADAVTTLCGDASQTLELKISGDKPPLPYITQYNETDLTFLARLLEGAGYFYFFTHTAADHTLVVTDQNQGFPPSPKPTMQVVHEGGGADVLTLWHKIGSTAHTKYTLLDYDPLNPGTLPEGDQPTKLATAGTTAREVFEWPALATTGSAATDRARIKMEAAEAEANLFEALGEDASLGPGSRFTVATDPFDSSQGTEYVVRSVSASGQDHGWVTGDAAPSYANRITAFNATVTWREKLTTPRPAMSGIHSAIVLGASGEEIHADKYGRIKVRFFWDHRKDATADTACWVRVIQPWAGNTWGHQHLPRVGTEVAVAFLDGDPDRPVVIGGFYNGQMMPVFAVPDEQTKSGFRSRSTTNGSTSTFSELSFDDKKGSELVFFHAEKDMTVEVENAQKISVGDAQTVTVKNGRTTTISKAGDSLTVDNGGITITASQSDISVKASAGSISMEAMNSIELKLTSGNSIKIDSSGVTITATIIKLAGQSMVQVDAPMTKVSADGMMTLKGGIMTLN